MSESADAAPGRIFMSYRREETAYPAAWLFERLASHFGRDQIFKDVDSIELGDDFVEVITTAVGSCEVLLALIGSRWLTVTDQDGHRRLDDPSDFVRLEIEAALTRNVRVIPILVDEARMPRADELPASLAKLARRQALELNPGRFEADTRRLLRVLDRTVDMMLEQAPQKAGRAARHQEKIEQPHGQIRDRAGPVAAKSQPVPPRLEPTTTSLDFGSLTHHSASPELSIRLGNAGGGNLNAHAVPQASWIRLRQQTDQLYVAADTDVVGTYEGTITIESDGGSATIFVKADIVAAPQAAPATPASAKAARLVDAGFVTLVIPLCVIALEALIRPQTFLAWPWWVITAAAILGIAITLGAFRHHAVPVTIVMWVMTWSAVYSLSVIGTRDSAPSTLTTVLSTECMVAAVVSIALCIWIVILLPKGIRSAGPFLAIFMGCFSAALILAAVALHTGQAGAWTAVGAAALAAALGVILTLIQAQQSRSAC